MALNESSLGVDKRNYFGYRMANRLNLAGIFASEAKELEKARERARILHPSDIRAAGNEVEQAVRDYLRRMLPPRFYVTHGHLIDSEHRVSPQMDVIIADNFSLPSLITAKDGTKYVPVTSVLAIGEVKSTYHHAKGYYSRFHDALNTISQMNRPLVENTIFKGINDTSTIRDMTLGSTNKYLNNLFSFMLCVDGGDFDILKVRNLLVSTDVQQLPNVAIFLNRGVVAYANRHRLGATHKYPNEVNSSDFGWCFMELRGSEEGTMEGAHLAYLFGQLISHLSNSHLEPASAYEFIAAEMIGRKSSMIWADQ